MADATNAVADIAVRALVIIFAFAAGAFLEDMIAGDLGSKLALAGRVLAIGIAVVWAFLDGRSTGDIRWVLAQWLAVAALVGLAAGFVFKVVFDRAGNGAEPASWFGLGVFPFLITLVPALAAAGLGHVMRGRLGSSRETAAVDD